MRWSQLVVLMALGEGPEPTLVGVVSCRWSEPLNTVSLPATGELEDVNGAGQMSPYEATYRVVKHGDRIRRERLDGAVTSIEHGREFWTMAPGEDIAVHHRATHMTFPDHQLTHRRALRDWSRTDYTQPTGPILPVTQMGRPAWRVEVAPPPRKQHPLTWVIDDQTGYVLSAESGGGDYVRWDHLEVGSDIDPAAFVWFGPTRALAVPDRRTAPRRLS